MNAEPKSSVAECEPAGAVGRGWFKTCLLLIVMLGLLVRLPGVWWGLSGDRPSYYHPDEDRIARQAVHLLNSGDPDDYYPHGFAMLLSLTRYDERPDSWRELVFPARLLSLSHSVATIPLIAWIGWMLGLGSAGTLAAAACFAFAGVCVVHAHFGVADSALVFWTTLSVAVALALKRRPRLAATASAIAAGFALCIKMGWPAVLPAVLVAGRCRRRWVAIPVTLLVSLAAFRLLDPMYTWNDFMSLRRMVAVENVKAVRGHIYAWNPLVLAILVVVGVGLPFAILACRGLWSFVRQGWRKWLEPEKALVIVPSIGFAVAFVCLSVSFPRHVLPVIPAVALLAGYGWKEFARAYSTRATVLIASLLMAYQAIYLFSIERNYVHDSRPEMEEWLNANLGGDATIHLAPYAQLHSWRSLGVRSKPESSSYVLIHEADYWRYRRSAVHPFNRTPLIRETYRPGMYGSFYKRLIRNHTSFREIMRVKWRAFTPELLLHRRFWGSYPEFVGDTVLYARETL